MARLKVTGQAQLRKNMKRAIRRINTNFRKGIVDSVRLVKKESLKETPVEFGDLKRSAFSMVKSGKGWVSGIVGYNAEYAFWVHQSRGTLMGDPRPSGMGNYWDPNGQPLFLQYALIDNMSSVVNLLISNSSKRPI